MLIVLTRIPKGPAKNRNVYGVNLDEKNIKWQIPKFSDDIDDYECPS